MCFAGPVDTWSGPRLQPRVGGEEAKLSTVGGFAVRLRNGGPYAPAPRGSRGRTRGRKSRDAKEATGNGNPNFVECGIGNSTAESTDQNRGQELQRRTGMRSKDGDPGWVISALAPVGAFLFQFPRTTSPDVGDNFNPPDQATFGVSTPPSTTQHRQTPPNTTHKHTQVSL
ncbi:hypothetical protein CORC01_12896 [Colletotrichum orchidophilum]|uniref:Uncharacterized protein n=1 Tax=Colletotrichum orchidophilum TaxID=1209926 RepID=A0A1G4AS20_9PEZI|nr:uncharacterized protein CORC01_12896 [Colletotrichum orchidophilum]OHE91822.1 hypothetical protein CORC01_12896 [Colletotrichum orchidophilum]